MTTRALAVLLLVVLVCACAGSTEPSTLQPSGVSQTLPADPTCPANVPNVDGEWRTLPYAMPINPIAAQLMRDGTVLFIPGSENDAFNNAVGSMAYRGAVWDPAVSGQASITTYTFNYDMFCHDMAALPDGRPLIVGGSRDYSFKGENRVSIWNPQTSAINEVQSMADGRWYPTLTALGDGRIMAWSGTKLLGGTNTTVEIYDVKTAAGWGAPVTGMPITPPLYPRMHLLPSGKVFYTGQGSGTRSTSGWLFDPVAKTWAQSAATTTDRNSGTSVLLGLYPPSYTPHVAFFGGAGLASTERIDLSGATPAWSAGPNMTIGRIQNSATLLPNGKVIIHGGSAANEIPDTGGKNGDLYDPVSNTMGSGGTSSYSRLYHSVSLLLPDATVAVFGSNPGSRARYEPAIEIYTPPYLFDANGALITTNRPAITGVSATTLGYGAAFTASFTSASAIASAVLVRPGSATHAMDGEQRLIGLCGASPQPACSAAGGTLSLTTPATGNVAPPGWYMLFLIDASGVPSKAKFVQLRASTGTPPTGTISSPTGDTTITAGGSVSFGTATVASQYAWAFPGGSPASSASQNPGGVTFATAGTFVVTMTAIDASGNTDPNPPTRTITVLPTAPDFKVAVSPTVRSVLPGQSATYTVTVTGLSGFAGNVTLAVSSESGFPTGITSGGFSPPTVTGSGVSTLTMNTTSGSPPYALSLTISGISGSTRRAPATLVVALAPPTGLVATAGNGQVGLTWTAAPVASKYMVKRSLTAGGPYTTLGCATGTSYTDLGLTNGTTYYYTVVAVVTTGQNGGGASAVSSEASATPVGEAPPAAPTNLVAVGGTQQVTLSWNASPGATGYRVKRSSVSGGPYTLIGSPGAPGYVDGSLANGTTYHYVVSAVNLVGEGANSAQASGTTAPAAPTGLTRTNGNTMATLKWTAAAGAESYRIKRGTTSGGPYTLVGTSTTPSFVHTGLTNGVNYYYRVSSVNSLGVESADSNQVTVKAGATTLVFNTPASGATVSGTAVAIKVTATYALGTKTYRIYVDGVLKNTKDTTSNSRTYNWNSTGVANGPHTLTATVTDQYGFSASPAPLGVTVQN